MGTLCNCNERGIIESKEVILEMPRYVIMPPPTLDMCAEVFFVGLVDKIKGFVDILNLVDNTRHFLDISSCLVDRI